MSLTEKEISAIREKYELRRAKNARRYRRKGESKTSIGGVSMLSLNGGSNYANPMSGNGRA